MAFCARFPVRFADLDWGRVVYFARYFDFAHRASEEFFNAHPPLEYANLLVTRSLGFPVVHSEADFFAPFRLGDTARIVMDVTRLSKRSVTSRFTFYRGENDERCAVIVLKQAVIQTVEYRGGVEFPEDIHALFSAHLIPATTSEAPA